MRRFSVLAALAVLLGGVGGSGPVVRQSAASPAAKEAVAVAPPPAPSVSSATVPAATPAVWKSYAWQPWSQYDRSVRRWSRDRPGRDNRWRTYRSWPGEYSSGRPRNWQEPQRFGWRYDERGYWPRGASRGASRGTWNDETWADRAWQSERWRSEFRRPWTGERRWVNSR